MNVGARIWCLRHAESENVIAGLAGVMPMSPLTSRGFRQAAAAARALATEPIARVYCSTALRTRQTARALLASRAIDIVTPTELAEVGIGRAEATTDPGVRQRTAAALHGVRDRRAATRPDSGPPAPSALHADRRTRQPEEGPAIQPRSPAGPSAWPTPSASGRSESAAPIPTAPPGRDRRGWPSAR